ncbi:MAG: hypothetical protein V4671_19505 [Armatimonadota bacterium]
MTVTFEALPKWPTEETYPRTSRHRFKATYPTIKSDLEGEIDKIGGYNVLIEADIVPRGILRSGWPGSDARTISHPGVRLSFTIDTKTGPTVLEFACDEYDGWQANLRGISLTLEALRDIKRHGATRNQQQYAGFRKALPSGKDSRMMAAELLASRSRQASILHKTSVEAILSDVDAANAAYRVAASRFHPDNAETGDAEMFAQLTDAITLLRQ